MPILRTFLYYVIHWFFSSWKIWIHLFTDDIVLQLLLHRPDLSTFCGNFRVSNHVTLAIVLDLCKILLFHFVFEWFNSCLLVSQCTPPSITIFRTYDHSSLEMSVLTALVVRFGIKTYVHRDDCPYQNTWTWQPCTLSKATHRIASICFLIWIEKYSLKAKRIPYAYFMYIKTVSRFLFGDILQFFRHRKLQNIFSLEFFENKIISKIWVKKRNWQKFWEKAIRGKCLRDEI